MFHILTSFWYCQRFLTFAFLMSTQWFLAAISVCIFLITNNVEHHFIYLLIIHISSIVKYLFFACFYCIVSVFCCWFKRILYKFLIWVLCQKVLWHFLPQAVAWLLIFLTVPLVVNFVCQLDYSTVKSITNLGICVCE